jgi:glucose-6-phosphate 1-dehydrogenase
MQRDPGSKAIVITLAGASGDLAKKKTYPALYFLYSHGCVFIVLSTSGVPYGCKSLLSS